MLLWRDSQGSLGNWFPEIWFTVIRFTIHSQILRSLCDYDSRFPDYCSSWQQTLVCSKRCWCYRLAECKDREVRETSTQILEEDMEGQGVSLRGQWRKLWEWSPKCPGDLRGLEMLGMRNAVGSEISCPKREALRATIDSAGGIGPFTQFGAHISP